MLYKQPFRVIINPVEKASHLRRIGGTTDMNIKDLENIITVIEEGNITSAAKRLFMSQPSLSQCIQRVEAELSTTLFIRTKSGIELTNAGRAFQETAEKVCKEYRDLENRLADLSTLHTGYLVVGIPTLLNGYLLPEGYMYFRQKYPNVRIDLYEDDSNRLESMLFRGKVDLAIMSLPVDPSLISVPMISCEMVLCAPGWYEPGDALLDPRTGVLDIRKLDMEPFIFPRPSQKLHMVTEKILKKANISVQTILNTRSSKGAMLYCAHGFGFTIQPEISVRFHRPLLNNRVKFFRIPPEFNEQWVVVLSRSRNGYFSEAAQTFIQSMQEFYSPEPPAGWSGAQAP